MIFEIERRAGRLLTRLGYQTTVATVDADPWDVLAIPRGLSSFPTLAIPIASPPPLPQSRTRLSFSE